MKEFVKLNQISKAFGGTRALSGVSFGINQGAVHAIVGENGAGKSTLMKILMGILKPDSGQILLDDSPVSILDPVRARQLGFGIVFQEIVLCPNLSITENLFLGSELSTAGIVNRKEMKRQGREALEQVQLKLDPATPVASLPVAQKQMVQIARAVLYKPRLLIFDEPTSALSSESVDSLFKIIRRLKQEKVTVLYISHKLEEIFEIADEVTVLRDGIHIDTLPIREVSEQKLVQMMVGRELDLSSRRSEVKSGEVLLKVDGLCGEGFESVSFEVKAGEIVGIAGLVGSGRSELVETIFGVRPAAKGKIFLGQDDITTQSVAGRARKGMALVPEDRQFAGLVFTMALKQNLALPGVVIGWKELGGKLITNKRETAFAEEAMRKLRIVANGPNAEVSSLSGGNQQKAVIGKWLSLKPKLFMLDEPTRGIDVGSKAEIHNLVRELANQGRALLIVSSELPELLALADRILVMREGRMMGELCGERACEEEILRLAVATIPEKEKGLWQTPN